jgi:hypothetical protein
LAEFEDVVCHSKVLPPVGTDVEHHIRTSGSWNIIGISINCAGVLVNVGRLRVYYSLLNKLSNALVSRKFCEWHNTYFLFL